MKANLPQIAQRPQRSERESLASRLSQDFHEKESYVLKREESGGNREAEKVFLAANSVTSVAECFI
jgi:hypothetical protein